MPAETEEYSNTSNCYGYAAKCQHLNLNGNGQVEL